MSLKSKLESGQFAVSCEFKPPKGTDTQNIRERVRFLKGKVDVVNVTDQPKSTLHLSGLVTASLCVQSGLEPIFQLTCRDRNRIALQSDLLGAWVMGIKNVLALTGDLPSLGDHPRTMGVFDLDSVTLLQAITSLNNGTDLSGNELDGKPDFFPGAVVKVASNTVASEELQVIKLEKKIAAGAKFFQTQAIYDPATFEKFMNRVSRFNVPVMAGIIPLKSAAMARYLDTNVAGIEVPDSLINESAEAPREERDAIGIRQAADLIKAIKPMCQGVHIMAIGWEKHIPEIMEEAGL